MIIFFLPKRFNTKSKGRLSQTKHIQTVGLCFKYALIELLHKLTRSSPHFVRCIRSNMDFSGSIFERDMVKHQIKYHGICDTIRIRQQGFSHRLRYQEFLRRWVPWLLRIYGTIPTPPKEKAWSHKSGNIAKIRTSRQGAKNLQFLSGCNF